MEELKFSAHQLIIGTDNANSDALSAAFSESDDHYVDGEVHYHIEKESLLANKFFWIYCSYGKAYPHTDQVYDIESEQLEDNPRKPTQIEPNKQLFCLYDASAHVLYLSNSQKKKMIENYLKSKLEKDVIVKNFYVDAESFANAIDTISTVKLITTKNLFSEQSGLFSEAKDIFGLGEIEDFTLEAHFKKARKTENFVRMLREWATKRGQGEIESLVCIGYDDSNIETVFNADNLIKKVPLYAKKDGQGLFKAEEVRSSLLNIINKAEENVSNS